MRTKKIAITANLVKDSEINFTLVVKGKWDFNRDLAGDKFDNSPLIPVSEHASFRAALQAILANAIFNHTSNCFDSVKLTELQASSECETSFLDLKKRIAIKDKAEAEQELERLQKREKELKDKIKTNK